MNAKYISSSVVKNQYFHECVARVYLLIFSPHDIYLVFTGKKSQTFWFFLVCFGSFSVFIETNVGVSP